ncbi:MAG: hypothetical protein WD036_06410 [Bauldia sp.]
MVDVSLRHKRRRPSASGFADRPGWRRPLMIVVAVVCGIVGLGAVFRVAIQSYHARMTLTGLSGDTRSVALSIAGETLSIPANMIRLAAARRGGDLSRVDLVLHWPALEGYSAALAEDFKNSSAAAAVVYATLSPRETPLDANARLDSVYARLFVGKPLSGPAGLVGRRLGEGSGYEAEIVYFTPGGPRPFVARCLVESTAEVPATCLRDIEFGSGLTLLYRFDRTLLDEWRGLDAGIQTLAAGFLDANP